MRKRYRLSPPLPGAFGLPLGFVAGIVGTLIAVMAGATGHPVVSLALLACMVAAVSALTTPAAAFGTAVLCWLLHDGFVLGRQGDLAATPLSARAAVVLVSAAVVTSLIAVSVRKARFRRAVSEWSSLIPRQLIVTKVGLSEVREGRGGRR